MSNISENEIFGTGADTESTASDKQDEVLSSEVIGGEDQVNDGDILEILSRMRGMLSADDDDDIDDEDIDDYDGMDSDDYHNKAVDFARSGKVRRAAEICMDGLKRFPFNVDLLADTVKYSAEAGDTDIAAKHYALLKENVPIRCWNWRAFTFSFDYLIGADPIANEAECREIVEAYKTHLPQEEKARMAECELEIALGNGEESMNVLKEAISTLSNASQCALRLADMQLDRGLYRDVIATANYGIAASAEVQPSINVPYLYYIRALAKDHILHKKECAAEPVSKGEVSELMDEYALMIDEFPELRRHERNIKMRMKMLKFIKAE